MSLELKDFITFAFSAGALAISFYNFLHTRSDAKSRRMMQFEQKRFEAVTVAEEIKTQYAQIASLFQGLLSDALLADIPPAIEILQREVSAAKRGRTRYATLADQLRNAPTPDRQLHKFLLDIEKHLGELRAGKAAMLEVESSSSNVVETVKRMFASRGGAAA